MEREQGRWGKEEGENEDDKRGKERKEIRKGRKKRLEGGKE